MQLLLLGYQQIVNNAGFKGNLLFFNLADIMAIYSVNSTGTTAPSSYRRIRAPTFADCIKRAGGNTIPERRPEMLTITCTWDPTEPFAACLSDMAPVGGLPVEFEDLDPADQPFAAGLLLEGKL